MAIPLNCANKPINSSSVLAAYNGDEKNINIPRISARIPIVIVEVFSALKTLLNWNEAEYRTSSLLRSKRIVFLSISKEASQNSVQWAKEKKIPVNDAMIGANMVEQANLIYTVDEDHFKKLEEYGVKILNPIRPWAVRTETLAAEKGIN